MSEPEQKCKIHYRAVVVVKWSALYSDDLSSNTARVYSFYCVKLCEKNENKGKRDW